MTHHDDSLIAILDKLLNKANNLETWVQKATQQEFIVTLKFQTKCSMSSWHKNKYGIYCFDEESDTDESYFVDNTNIIWNGWFMEENN